MLLKKNRLTRKSSPKSHGGKRFGGVYATILITKDAEKTFSFVVPAKMIKRATTRNLLKRRARGIIKKYINKIKNNKYVFIFKNKSDKLTFEKLEEEIISLLKQTKSL